MGTFYTDHNFSQRISEHLTEHIVYTARQHNKEQADDSEHLLFAATNEWTLVTHNIKDFLLLHQAWRLWSQAWGVTPKHSGILALDPSLRGNPAPVLAEALQRLALASVSFENQFYRWRPGTWEHWEPDGSWRVVTI